MAERDFDVVVLGATGVTGRRIAEYLAKRVPEIGARWAAVARDPVRLDRLLAEEGIEAPETLVADVTDPTSLASLASRTRVVLNAAGPYTLYAEPVIEACVEAGAHYADLTGEIPHVRRMIDRFHAPASAAGVKIVQVCGWECLPADLAVLLAVEAAGERWGETVSEAELAMRQRFAGYRPKWGEGAATFRSGLAVFRDRESPRAADPAALVSDEADAARVRQHSPVSLGLRRGEGGRLLAPLVPYAFIGPAVIHRTTALLAAERGVPFEPLRYREAYALGGRPPALPLRFAAAAGLAGVQAAVARLFRVRPGVRRRVADAFDRMLPDRGYSPPVAQQREMGWTATLATRTADGREIRVEIDADGYYGYLSTGRMIGEA